MPLPGGAAEKFGNRYEGRWTVACLLDVMDERADSVRLEPPGLEGQGVEFWITKRGIREYHQVKRQHYWALDAPHACSRGSPNRLYHKATESIGTLRLRFRQLGRPARRAIR